jgi:hypothetical protein
MDKRRRRAKVLSAIAVVLVLHLTVIWLLVATSRVLSIRTKSQSLEMVLIARPVVAPENNSIGRVLEGATPRRQIRAKHLPTRRVAPEENENNAIHPPTDWAGELSRVAKDAVSESSAQKPRDFGFPHSPVAPTGKTPQFGWDYVATHRIEAIPEGGLLLHLNDNCVLILFPLPVCRMQHRKEKGEWGSIRASARPATIRRHERDKVIAGQRTAAQCHSV